MNNNEFQNKDNDNQMTETNSKKEASYGGSQYRWNYDDYQRSREIKKKKSNSTGLKVFAITMTAVFLVCFMTLTGVLIYDYAFRDNSPPASSNVDDDSSKTNGNSATPNKEDIIYVKPYNSGVGEVLSIPEIAEKAKPSVVGVLVKNTRSSNVGTGIILTEDGYIATNNHVVSGGEVFTIILQDKTEIEAKLVGVDNLTDLAVLKIEGNDYPAAEIGDSDNLVVGEPVVAIGTPAGIEFAGTVTNGIVSAINRDVEIYDNYGTKVVKTMTVIQTNANINPGNSGGPLLNNRGEVIGINTMKLSNGYEGIGFALPITGALPIINALIKDGAVTDRPEGSFAQGRPVLGITGEDVSEFSSKIFKLPQGVMVKYISPDSNIYKAGISIGDIIVEYDGKEVKTIDDISKINDNHKIGDNVKIKVFRNNDYLEAEFKLSNG